MRLQGVADGAVFATDYRRVFVARDGGSDDFTFEQVGRLPNPAEGVDSVGYRLRTTRGWKSAVEALVGRFPSVNLHPLGGDDLLATTGSYLFSSHDGGATWTLRHRLPASSGPMGVLPTAVCVHDGDVYLGEYPLDNEAVPRVLTSADDGRTWEEYCTLPEVRHVHAIQPDPYTGELWLTAGDTDEQSRIGRLRDGGLDVVGTGSQRWRAVDLAFTEDSILWGVDSGYTATNPVLRLDRDQLSESAPEPQELTDAANSVFYAETLEAEGEEWVVVSTAVEVMADSTAPAAGARGVGQARVLAASATTEFTEWHELAAYDRKTALSDRLAVVPGLSLPRSAAYVFLAVDPAGGLLVNPWNTKSGHGTIGRVRPAAFPSLDG